MFHMTKMELKTASVLLNNACSGTSVRHRTFPNVLASAVSVTHRRLAKRLSVWTDRAGFWHGGFLQPVLHRVLRKFGYLQK